MNFEQLAYAIFENFEQDHAEILCDSMITTETKAEKILAKYNLKKISQEQIEAIRKEIVRREVDIFMQFVADNKEVLDGDFTFKQKLNILMEKYMFDGMTDKQISMLRSRISRHIQDNEVGKILSKLADDLKL